MKKIYKKPETKVIEIQMEQFIAQSPGTGQLKGYLDDKDEEQYFD